MDGLDRNRLITAGRAPLAPAVYRDPSQFWNEFSRSRPAGPPVRYRAVAGAGGAGARGTGLPVPSAVTAPSSAAQVAVNTALAQVGDPYVWGAGGPDAFDCSGSTSSAYAAAGVTRPHSSRSQSRLGTPVPRGEPQPGDLVFFCSPVSHVGMYVGNGQMVHASTSGQPVKVASLDSMGSYNGARRVTG